MSIFRHFAQVDEEGIIGNAYGFLDEGLGAPELREGYTEITEYYNGVDFEALQDASSSSANLDLAIRDGKVVLIDRFVFTEGVE